MASKSERRAARREHIKAAGKHKPGVIAADKKK